MHFDSIPLVLLAQHEVHGILPTRGSLMLDVVVLVMLLVVAVLPISIYLVRYEKKFVWHRNIQIALVVLLALTVFAFEIDMRLFSDWREQAAKSPYYDSGMVMGSLYLHLVFAVPAPFLWMFVVIMALRKFDPVQPGEYSQWHKFWGRLAAIVMVLTALTGWLFYWLAFVA